MTDKEIIIDRVNVAGCEWYEEHGGIEYQGMWEYSNGCYLSQVDNKLSTDCAKNPNCLYKQLQRKEQECEELKKKLQYAAEENKFQFILREENDRYEQALDKIEETVSPKGFFDEVDLIKRLNVIKDIINEVNVINGKTRIYTENN